MEQTGEFRLAVDLGSTTIGYGVISGDDDSVVKTGIIENPGVSYGKNIMSRMGAYVAGAKDIITTKMRASICDLGAKNQVSGDIVVSANTTMNHMLLGYDCEGLMEAPYRPVTLEGKRDESFRTFPGFSAFVGGDIVSGVRYLSLDKKEEISLLIDLGTNGEMVLGNRHGFVVSSVAAGPAFEEWGASHGMYGSGVIDICCRLLKTGIIDKNGTFLDDGFLQNGFPISGIRDREVFLTQDDIRDIQLAKAAVRAGVELLLKLYGISYEDVAHIYLAGGMGEHLKVESAVALGMLPPHPHITYAGNTSLLGAIEEVIYPDTDRLRKITELGTAVLLSEDERFNDIFVENMSF